MKPDLKCAKFSLGSCDPFKDTHQSLMGTGVQIPVLHHHAELCQHLHFILSFFLLLMINTYLPLLFTSRGNSRRPLQLYLFHKLLPK